MNITHKNKPTDPVYPIMEGKTPMAKEFNKRQKLLWGKGNISNFNFEQIVTTVLLEILIEDYDERHMSQKKIKHVKGI